MTDLEKMTELENIPKFVCIKETKCYGNTSKATKDKICKEGNFYHLEEKMLGGEKVFWHVDTEEGEYLGIVTNLDCFITLAEWREIQINKILEDD